MDYFSEWINGVEIKVKEADVLECMEFFQCSYEDALWHAAYAEWFLQHGPGTLNLED